MVAITYSSQHFHKPCSVVGDTFLVSGNVRALENIKTLSKHN